MGFYKNVGALGFRDIENYIKEQKWNGSGVNPGADPFSANNAY